MTSKETQTNKLLLRLDRLISEGPLDPKQRKEFEQSIVYWAPDVDVPLCPHCGLRFLPLARRRHHCRLCGAVLCAACSLFLPYKLARVLTAPPADDGDSADAAAATAPGLGFIQRSGSESSLHSLLTAAVVSGGGGSGGLNSSREALVIRVCPDCRDCLEFRRHRSAARQQSTLMPASPISELYRQMRIDAVSLRIASLSAKAQTPDPDEASDSSAGLQKQLRQQQLAKEARVERAIRAYAVAFVREGLLIVACLPTPDQLRELRAQRAEQQRREAEARRAAVAAKEQQQQQRSRAAPPPAPPPPPPPQGAFVAATARRRPAAAVGTGADEEAADPLLEQIGNLRDFIGQARQAGRADEVRALEANLAELLAELHARQEAERRQANAAANKPPAPPPPPRNPFEPEVRVAANPGSNPFETETDEVEYRGVNPFD
uniref:FYVE-type domain-containing protein n=1 Tax=Macrostomum lignano TaxID=282301 RepID=A0A1I8IX93_9PLAT